MKPAKVLNSVPFFLDSKLYLNITIPVHGTGTCWYLAYKSIVVSYLYHFFYLHVLVGTIRYLNLSTFNILQYRYLSLSTLILYG